MGHANLQWVYMVLLLRTNITSTNHRRGDFCEIQDWQVAVNLESSTGQVKTRPRGCCQWQQLPSRTVGAREIHLQRRGRRPHYRLGCLAPTQAVVDPSRFCIHVSSWIQQFKGWYGSTYVNIYVNKNQAISSPSPNHPQQKWTIADHFL